MYNHDFDFETTADPEGNILVEEEFDMAIPVTIKDLSVETTSNCNNRSHRVVVSIDDSNIVDKVVNDCNELHIDFDPDLSISPDGIF